MADRHSALFTFIGTSRLKWVSIPNFILAKASITKAGLHEISTGTHLILVMPINQSPIYTMHDFKFGTDEI